MKRLRKRMNVDTAAEPTIYFDIFFFIDIPGLSSRASAACKSERNHPFTIVKKSAGSLNLFCEKKIQ